MAFYNRKSPRMAKYDYSAENYYFITICTHNRRCLFGRVNELNDIGVIAKRHIEAIISHYDYVHVDKYVVMPNHIHFILYLSKGGRNDVEQIIAQYKAGVSREVRKLHPNIIIWQRSFHDHVIRSQSDYERTWLYIEGNPQCWDKDCFYIDQSIVPGW